MAKYKTKVKIKHIEAWEFDGQLIASETLPYEVKASNKIGVNQAGQLLIDCGNGLTAVLNKGDYVIEDEKGYWGLPAKEFHKRFELDSDDIPKREGWTYVPWHWEKNK